MSQENEVLTKELSELRLIREQQTMTSSNVEAQLNAARAEKDLIIEELLAEKERLQQQIDHLQNVSIFVLLFYFNDVQMTKGSESRPIDGHVYSLARVKSMLSINIYSVVTFCVCISRKI